MNPNSDNLRGNTSQIKDDLTYKVIGCAMKVHSTLGNGFQEVIYQRALEIEFNRNNISFEREKSMDIFYEGEYIGNRRVDFMIEDSLIVELKALIKLEPVHLAQGLNYLVAYNVEKGLLLNFGAQSLEVKRLHHPVNKHNPNNPPIL
jgi:GxxExxY protein